MIRGIAPKWVCALLQEGSTATVELVTSKGVYVDLCGHKILLCGSAFGVIPNGVSVQSPLQLVQGMRIACKDIQVTVAEDDTAICMGNSALMLQCLQNDPGTGFGLLLTEQPLPPQCVVAKPLLQKLYDSILKDDRQTVESSVFGLLGLGKGLTPSGDDVLAGLIYGLRHSPVREQPIVVYLAQLLKENAHRLTNGVSADYLCAVVNDQPFERLSDAWRKPLCCGPRLMEIGSNSGREMLLGLIIAACIVQKI